MSDAHKRRAVDAVSSCPLSADHVTLDDIIDAIRCALARLLRVVLLFLQFLSEAEKYDDQSRNDDHRDCHWW